MKSSGRSQLPNPVIQDEIEHVLQRIRQIPEFEHVQFIIFFGSAEEQRMTKESDIDLCVYFDGNIRNAAEFRYKILSMLPGTRYDIKIFQMLPLYIRMEVLKGTPVFVRDSRFLYEKATETIRDFNAFRHRLYDYTGQAAIL